MYATNNPPKGRNRVWRPRWRRGQLSPDQWWLLHCCAHRRCAKGTPFAKRLLEPKMKFLNAQLLCIVFIPISKIAKTKFFDAQLLCIVVRSMCKIAKLNFFDAQLLCIVFRSISKIAKTRFFDAQLLCIALISTSKIAKMGFFEAQLLCIALISTSKIKNFCARLCNTQTFFQKSVSVDVFLLTIATLNTKIVF